MKVLHWMVMITSFLTALIVWLPSYLMRALLMNSLRVASQACEKVLDCKIELPID